MIRHLFHAISSAVLVVWVSVPCWAGGEPADRDLVQQAGAHFAQGVGLSHDHEWRRALLEFEKAYQLSPDYRVLYNVAICRRSLGDYVAAFQAVQAFLAAPSLSEERRQDARQFLEELRPELAQLLVTSVPAGAQVRVADAVVGTTPLNGPWVANPGHATVVVSKVGFVDVVREMELKKGSVAEVRIELVPVSARPDPRLHGTALRTPISSRWTSVPTLAFLGAAVLSAGAASAFGLAALTHKRDLDAVCRAGVCPSSSQGLLEAARRDAVLSTWSFAAAGLAVGGAAVYLLWPSAAPVAVGSGTFRVDGPRLGVAGTF